MEFGIVGLGKIGGALARNARDKGLRVVGHTRNGVPEGLKEAGVEEADEPGRFHQMLSPPRVVLLYVPAGQVVDQVIESLIGVLEPGDVVVDGGNSYWGDTVRRHERLQERDIGFVDAGTSGGIPGAREGACFMVGGEDRHVEQVRPMLERLAAPGGYAHVGAPGSGHFVKLVHNGIEFAMMQGIGEGIALLQRYHEERSRIDIPAALEVWRHGSVIRSWLVDLLADGYREHDGLKDVPEHVEDTGEVDWVVSDALHLDVPIPAIADSVMQLRSARDEEAATARAIAVMRRGFGGHPFGHERSLHEERRTGRIGGFPR